MKNTIRLICMLAALCVATPSFAKIGPRNLERNIRTVTKELRTVGRVGAMAYGSAIVAETVTPAVGVDGVIMRSAFDGTANHVHTSSLGAMPYPARIAFGLGEETGTDITMACTGDITIVGEDQFGTSIVETITTDLAEGTEVTSLYAYEAVDRISVTTCNGYDAGPVLAEDFVYVVVSDQVALPQKIDAKSKIISICARGVESGTELGCITGAQAHAAAFTYAPYYIMDLGLLDANHAATLGASLTNDASTFVPNTDIWQVKLRDPL